MGKIRVKSFGDEELELKEKEEAKKKKEAKIAEKKLSEAKSPEGTREAKVEEPKEEVVETEVSTSETPVEEKTEPKEAKRQEKVSETEFHSRKYNTLSDLVDKTKSYSLKEGLELLEKLQRKTIDETVELHINTVSTGISGNVTLPHGSGKKTRVAIANDELIASVEKGKIEFDILVAEPTMMVKLARVAKILGPRGLMPNPKNGTVTSNPQEVAKKYEGGQVNFKTEAKSPILHLVVGKMSMGGSKLAENTEEMLKAVKKSNIINVTLKSTMSPGIKIKI